MAVGDLKYKFSDNDGTLQEIEVPAAVLRSGKKAGLTNRQTILKYAAEHGFNVDAPKEAATPKKKVSRTRKPDEQKRQIIQIVSDSLGELGEINVVNVERQVQVVIDGETFELTLVKKRKQK